MNYDSDNAALFARLIRVKALGAGPEFAQAQWGPSSRIAALVSKGQILSTESLGSDADLRAASNGFVGLVRGKSLLGKIAAASGFRKVPMHTPVLAQQAPVKASWVAEGKQIPITSTTFDTETLPAKKMAALILETKELAEGAGANFESALSGDMSAAVAGLESISIIDPANPGSDYSPAAITHGVTPVTGSADPKADVQKLLDDFKGDLDTAVMVSSPSGGLELFNAGYIGAGVRGGDVAGIPLVTCSTVPAGQVSLVDPARILLADEGIFFDIAEETTLIDEDGRVISLWQLGLVAIRADRHVNWKALPGAVSLVTGASWA